MNRTDLVKRYRTADETRLRLTEVSPGDTWKLKPKDHAQAWLQKGVAC